MPRLIGGPVAQRIRYPNGTTSSPFLVPFSKVDVCRFAMRIIEDEWPEWKGCLNEHGRVVPELLAMRRAMDDFDSGSARLSCAHDGRFWSTLRTWTSNSTDEIGHLGPLGDGGRLTRVAAALLFSVGDEEGYHVLHGLGVEDVTSALARAALRWAEQIEEWA